MGLMKIKVPREKNIKNQKTIDLKQMNLLYAVYVEQNLQKGKVYQNTQKSSIAMSSTFLVMNVVKYFPERVRIVHSTSAEPAACVKKYF